MAELGLTSKSKTIERILNEVIADPEKFEDPKIHDGVFECWRFGINLCPETVAIITKVASDGGYSFEELAEGMVEIFCEKYSQQ